MDQTQLQEKIALYYQKLPEETKVLFAGMSWLETIKEIDTKYSLNDEQIKSLGTETTLLLLGIIDPNDYEQTLREEVKLEEGKTDDIIKEVNEKIVKDIAPLIYKSYTDNIAEFEKEAYAKNFEERFDKLPNEVKDAIAFSNWKEKLYTIANKYNLAVDKMGQLEDITANVFLGIIRADQYESEVTSKIEIQKEKIKEFVAEINESIFVNIKEAMKNSAEVGPSDENVPLPPYKVITSLSDNKAGDKLPITKETESEVPLPPKTEIKGASLKEITQESLQDNLDKLSTKSEADLYKEHGIEIISNNYTPEVENMAPIEIPKEKSMEVAPKKEGALIGNIVADKLFNTTVSQTTATDYSIPKMTPKPDPFMKAQGEASSNPHDPYHETI
ncbi:MAG: hypothetical protein UR85_C0002G0069 [Candidatus Nomurabacteria bacterium GW2011_GWF2_35_66]|uniref:Uncharacterized protein n=1 Tax=Candidatus Nomurabacteria bacterium GW2011_GWE1_35_16 TaxID=1618761 RepID=A0A0G0BB46_9BACT|nr:MAG: hypothetical protein UR55_C0004G0029 [Candidatus Nomurabacteria bacterium GW2011_GWF1_34_20]KKP63468.1 MAG: hypothetical protein UR57_C0004G0029 [Candidatus Nomurabacteria bacterium GW2011_GWE2_34_25]KKP66648.1 MAG: hypothetical protein UR64_C0004G0029 [Candidatus Nomurabacteria bacterium GW2011_GWE1_35_16]KKP83756.1 MAG: hypothetical protein UR85_C0002G0069 [Candidatus Nomurabacteria bacterium GW2011_GWF2_35_66]HAE36447.1 hypothetical protein [Candidatus Nomurabacteria bacterium]